MRWRCFFTVWGSQSNLLGNQSIVPPEQGTRGHLGLALREWGPWWRREDEDVMRHFAQLERPWIDARGPGHLEDSHLEVCVLSRPPPPPEAWRGVTSRAGGHGSSQLVDQHRGQGPSAPLSGREPGFEQRGRPRRPVNLPRWRLHDDDGTATVVEQRFHHLAPARDRGEHPAVADGLGEGRGDPLQPEPIALGERSPRSR